MIHLVESKYIEYYVLKRCKVESDFEMIDKWSPNKIDGIWINLYGANILKEKLFLLILDFYILLSIFESPYIIFNVWYILNKG